MENQYNVEEIVRNVEVAINSRCCGIYCRSMYFALSYPPYCKRKIDNKSSFNCMNTVLFFD